MKFTNKNRLIALVNDIFHYKMSDFNMIRQFEELQQSLRNLYLVNRQSGRNFQECHTSLTFSFNFELLDLMYFFSSFFCFLRLSPISFPASCVSYPGISIFSTLLSVICYLIREVDPYFQKFLHACSVNMPNCCLQQ